MEEVRVRWAGSKLQGSEAPHDPGHHLSPRHLLQPRLVELDAHGKNGSFQQQVHRGVEGVWAGLAAHGPAPLPLLGTCGTGKGNCWPERREKLHTFRDVCGLHKLSIIAGVRERGSMEPALNERLLPTRFVVTTKCGWALQAGGRLGGATRDVRYGRNCPIPISLYIMPNRKKKRFG